MLLLSVVQLAFGLIIVSSVILFVLLAGHVLTGYKSQSQIMYEFDTAEIRRSGAWQYDHDFFDQIEEFRNDFSR